MRTHLALVALTCAGLMLASTAAPQELADEAPQTPLAALGTAFTYQGQLTDGGSPANGSYDLQLKLFNALTSGTQVGSTVVKDNVGVAGGLFTVELDFTASVFTGQALWLEIGVRPGPSTGAFTTLSPRQPLNPAPFSHYAKAGVATDVQCGGCVSSSDLAASTVGVDRLAGGAATSGQVLTATGSSTMAWQSPSGPTGSGSAGQVAFWSGTSSLSGSNNLFWSNGAGRLGLGTTSPTEQLTLTGNLALPATTGTTGKVFMGGAAFIHAFGTNNTFLGVQAGNLSLTGARNSAVGNLAFLADTSGQDDTATGYGAMWANTSGSGNSAFGSGAMDYNTAGGFNTAVGYKSLFSNTTASHNTAVGVGALYAQDFANSGTPWDADNTAVGYEALNKNEPTSIDSGNKNTAVGSKALHENRTGYENVAAGSGALQNNTTAGQNTAIGVEALFAQGFDNGSLWGSQNTAVGYGALHENQPTNVLNGRSNTAIGAFAGYANTTGLDNVAVGLAALDLNQAASRNTAVGAAALWMSGFQNGNVPYDTYNTAVGWEAMKNNSPTSTASGDQNTAVGASSLAANGVGRQNTAVGFQSLAANSSGNYNVAIGYQALDDNTTGGGNVAIGHVAAQGFNGDNQLFIGNGLGTLMWGDFNTKRIGIGVTGAAYQFQLAEDSAGKPNGRSWANSSDARLKRDIAPLSGALERILRLQGVSFEWINPGEHGGRAESEGFIAQDVEKVFPEWVSFIDPSGADRALVPPGGKVRSLTLPFAFDAYLVEAIREQQEQIDAQCAALGEARQRAAEQDGAIQALRDELGALREAVASLQGAPPRRAP